jgi:Zn-dependent peptidase ImmA (M78 family)/transcriptional regulator with XRE-family HTH domain
MASCVTIVFMARTVEARVRAELLVWARESAGLTVDEAAKKAHVKPERLQDWEDGLTRPSIAQLRLLGRAYRRPLAIFYLAKPPKTFMPIRDFRRIGGAIPGQLSYELTLEIRRAHDRREVALELIRDLSLPLPPFEITISHRDGPERAAASLRTYFAVSPADQRGWKGLYGPFNAWRAIFERHGIVVFQAKGVSLDEMRGFSLTDDPLPTVVVNMADTPNGRVFSLAHELAHVALRRGGLCDMVELARRLPEEDAVEVFCNRVAAAFLLPADWILSDATISGHRGDNWSDDDLTMLAKRYNVSREAFLRRLLTLGKTTADFYRQKRQQFIEENRLRRQRADGFAPPDAVAVGRAGNFFTRLVLESYHRERITSGHVAEYLDVKLKHLQNIERAAALGNSGA